MNKNELKKMLKPLIKECIKEVLFEEDGALSHIIKEVSVGLSGKEKLTESKSYRSVPKQNNNKKLRQRKKQLLDAIGKQAYNGVDLFEGTTPSAGSQSKEQPHSPLSGVASSDPGVDISKIFSAKSFAMNQRMLGKE